MDYPRVGLISGQIRRISASALILVVSALCPAAFAENFPALADTTVLLIRHADKPEEGRELSPAGVERAKGYVRYFQSFQIDGQPLKLDTLFAAKDSKNSMRPRLTVEPLSRALDLPLNAEFKDKEPEKLAKELEFKPHGKNILICWHQGKMPDLLEDLGADPKALLPDGKWQENVYGWVIELRYDHQGKLLPDKCKRIDSDPRPN
jgi:hypothetical protein